MSHAILRFEKRKGGQVRALEAHHERSKQKYASNPDVDTAKSTLNYHIIKPEGSYLDEIQQRIDAAGCKVRKDSVRFIDTLITSGHEFFEGRATEDVRAYFEHAVDFMAQKVGRDNIFSAVVHLDEKTPHLHLCFVPLTPDKRLSAFQLMGNRKKLCEWQDEFHAHMAAKYPELKRGERAAVTHRKHLPVQLYKRATKLDVQREEIAKVLGDITPFNMKAKKEELRMIVEKWLPETFDFLGQLNAVNQQNTELNAQIAALAESYVAKDEQYYDKQFELLTVKAENKKLMQTANRSVSLLREIPADILAELCRSNPRLKKLVEGGYREKGGK